MSNEFTNTAVIGKVDVDANSALSMKFGVRNIPTILFIKNGEVVDKQVGVVPKSVLISKLQAHM
jgi:thioredoxin 1